MTATHPDLPNTPEARDAVYRVRVLGEAAALFSEGDVPAAIVADLEAARANVDRLAADYATEQAAIRANVAAGRRRVTPGRLA